MSTITAPIIDQQPQQPPPMAVVQQAYTAHSGHGSVGPVIAVLAVITVLGFVAGMIGRLCSGRRVMGHGQYFDFEGWVERKCSSCLDGTVGPPHRPQPPPSNASGVEVPVTSRSVETPAEIKEEVAEEQTQYPQQNSHARGGGRSSEGTNQKNKGNDVVPSMEQIFMAESAECVWTECFGGEFCAHHSLHFHSSHEAQPQCFRCSFIVTISINETEI
ncbi:hypothetical protein G4B88_007190 [Cannabis sativa]|uniref:Uncharacterized protein n=1 Tax=Cannabis sativa TaxID=3483 RepID=A0A7J6E4T3_CANSA|nr:hypothetical protein G4B88_007190 [Cannabis sativa]